MIINITAVEPWVVIVLACLVPVAWFSARLIMEHWIRDYEEQIKQWEEEH